MATDSDTTADDKIHAYWTCKTFNLFHRFRCSLPLLAQIALQRLKLLLFLRHHFHGSCLLLLHLINRQLLLRFFQLFRNAQRILNAALPPKAKLVMIFLLLLHSYHSRLVVIILLLSVHFLVLIRNWRLVLLILERMEFRRLFRLLMLLFIIPVRNIWLPYFQKV